MIMDARDYLVKLLATIGVPPAIGRPVVGVIAVVIVLAVIGAIIASAEKVVEKVSGKKSTPWRWQTGLLAWTWIGVFQCWSRLTRAAEAHWMGDVLLGAGLGLIGVATIVLVANRIAEWLGKRQAIRDDANSVWPPPAPPRT